MPTRNVGRAPANVEFLRTLHALSGMNKSAFARACGKSIPNMSAYLSGAKVPGKKALQSCLTHLHEWTVQPLMEVKPIPKKLTSLPTQSGVFVIYDSAGNVLYIGKATNFKAEIRQTLRRQVPVPIRLGPRLTKAQPKIEKLAAYLSLYAIKSSRGRHNLEALLLRIAANQTHNSNIGKFR